MGIKRRIDSITDKLSNKVDQKMLDYVSRFVYEDATPLENAISIYLCLGDVLCYSPRFGLTNDYSKLNLTGELNLENNEMICKSWSMLYHRLLKIYGIDSKVVRHKVHYKVEMILDGVIYVMDATAYGGNGLLYSMSDTARIKYGFKIDRFGVAGTVDPYDINTFTKALNGLKEAIDNVYARQNRDTIKPKRLLELRRKVIRRVHNHGKEVGVGSLQDINYRINIINRFWGLDLDNSPIEKIQLFNSFFYRLFQDFDDFDYTYKTYNIYARKDGKFTIYKLIALEINGLYYYFMDDGKKFSCYDRDSLYREFNRRCVRITEFTEIIGAYLIDQYKVRMK